MTEDEALRKRLLGLSSCNVSDALDKLGIKGVVIGIHPVWDCGRAAGRALTVKIVDAGAAKSRHHLGTEAIDAGAAGDLIVVDNGGRCDVSCWGGILATGARRKGIGGVVVDGACRDADEYEEIGFPIYSRAVVPCSARGRVVQESFNTSIQLGGVRVRAGDWVLADENGVAVIPLEEIGRVVLEAETLFEREEAMTAAILGGATMADVDREFRYEKMLDVEGKR
jgi:4-hydroxy-4-methyl-2-oxoglutarate aldolase